MSTNTIQINTKIFDTKLFWSILYLISIGLIVNTSASMPIGEKLYSDPFFFTKKQIVYLIYNFILSTVLLNTPINFWKKNNKIILFTSVLTLLIVIFIGTTINGSTRWINFYFLKVQPAEFSKLALFCYISSYLEKNIQEVQNKLWGFLKPIIIILIISFLLLKEPDLGTTIVLFITSLLMLFISGSKMWQLCTAVVISIITVIILIVTKPYRIKRILSFWNPWNDQFNTGYQLTESLMAFGKGHFIGEGLGNSLQKLEYLPEAHTDFILSILAEEFGYVGVLLTLLIIFFVSFRIMLIGLKVLKNKNIFSGYFCFSIGLYLSIQTIINVSGTIGILPTKGLTLPFISYGGSSLITLFISILIVLRIDFERRLNKLQAYFRDNI